MYKSYLKQNVIVPKNIGEESIIEEEITRTRHGWELRTENRTRAGDTKTAQAQASGLQY